MYNENKVLKIEQLMKEVLKELEIPITENTIDTPLRIAKMYCNELFLNRNDDNLDELNSKMKTFPAEKSCSKQTPIKINSIPFYSTCEHHFLPFGGFVDVEYIPNKRIIGLSKIPRIVKYFSKRPQLQERLTKDIGEYIIKTLNPLYVKVHIIATHDCVACRGAEVNCETETIFEWEDSTKCY